MPGPLAATVKFVVAPGQLVAPVGFCVMVGAVQAGYVSVTPLHLDLTHGPSLRRLKDAFA